MANDKSEEASRGLGRKERRRMKKRWKEEGSPLSLKEWAKKGEVGEASVAWLEHNRGSGGS
jgi:hypothetical protein